MASPRSNRGSVSGSSSASSVVSARSGYEHDANANGIGESARTVRYTRAGTLTSAEPHWTGREHIVKFDTYPHGFMSGGSLGILEAGQVLKVGEIYYNSRNGWVPRSTMKDRTEALAIDRAARILQSRVKCNSTNSPALRALRKAIAGNAAVQSTYVGCITKIKSSPDVAVHKVIVCTAAGHHLSIMSNCFEDASILRTGLLVDVNPKGGLYIARQA